MARRAKKRLPRPLPFATSEYKATAHTYEDFETGEIYDIARIHRLVENREPVWISLDRLTHIGTKSGTGFSKLQVRWANTRYPLIVTPEGNVIDGRHRLIKMRQQGRKRGRVHFVTPEELRRCRCIRARAKK